MFASAATAAVFLILNGLMLFGAERLRRGAPARHDERTSDERIAHGSPSERRSGSGPRKRSRCSRVLALGRDNGRRPARGLSNEDAARYAFLLATPIIGAAAVLKLPDLFGLRATESAAGAGGALCAAVTRTSRCASSFASSRRTG